MQPPPGSAETFREYLRQGWDAGYRNGRMLFDDLRALGYGGTYKAVGKILSPWRLGNVAFERAANDVTIPVSVASRPHRAPDLPADRRGLADDPAA